MTPRASDKNEAADQGIGAARDSHETNPLVRSIEKAVEELRTARTYIERDLDRGREDVRELRDQAHKDMIDVSGRLKGLEIKVGELPSKVWIGGVVATGALVLFGLITLVVRISTGH